MEEKRPHYFLGLKLTCVPGAGTCRHVLAQPQVHFRPHYLVIPKEVAQDFLILDIKVSKNSEFISCDPIPASTFGGEVVILKDRIVSAEPYLPIRMYFDLCRPGEAICITVQNLNASSRNFTGCLIGPVIE